MTTIKDVSGIAHTSLGPMGNHSVLLESIQGNILTFHFGMGAVVNSDYYIYTFEVILGAYRQENPINPEPLRIRKGDTCTVVQKVEITASFDAPVPVATP